jgi:hypothetical protein
VLEAAPYVRDIARADRAFLANVVRHLTGDLGIRQFLDIGTGLPAANNTHQVAQQAVPESRFVDVDNDRCKPGCVHVLPTPERHERYLSHCLCSSEPASTSLLSRAAPWRTAM